MAPFSMSRALIARNRDLRRLEDEGYTLRIIDDAYLMVENVPYVTAQSQVEEGALVMELTLTRKTHQICLQWRLNSC